MGEMEDPLRAGAGGGVIQVGVRRAVGERKARVSVKPAVGCGCRRRKRPRDWPCRALPGWGWGGRLVIFQGLTIVSPTCHWIHIYQHLF